MSLLSLLAAEPDPGAPIAQWLFNEPSGPYYTTRGDLPLLDTNTTSPSHAEGVGAGRAVVLGHNRSLYIPASGTGRLSIGTHGGSAVSVAAWVNCVAVDDQWFVAGIWQEDGADPKRQYGVFGSLPGLNMPSRSCFHVSRLGGASPGWIYSYDASGNPTPRAASSVWQMYVGTYDGQYARSYLDGTFTEDPTVFSPRATSQRNPYHYPDGLNTTSGAFTVGAITGPNPVTDSRSYLNGKVADLRVWARALTAQDIADMYATERDTYFA